MGGVVFGNGYVVRGAWLLFMVYGLWLMVYRFMIYGLWFMAYGSQVMVVRSWLYDFKVQHLEFTVLGLGCKV